MMNNFENIFETFKGLLLSYIKKDRYGGGGLIDDWFDRNFDFYYSYSKKNEDWSDMITDDFRTFAFNSDDDESDESQDFWCYTGDDVLNDSFRTRDFIMMMVTMAKDFRDDFNFEIDLINEYNCPRKIWNALAYWGSRRHEMEEPIKNLLEKEWEKRVAEKERDEDNATRTCDICYEAKQIHACCSSCKGKMLCRVCYNKVDNQCPFCRRMMIYNSKLFRPLVQLEEKCCVSWIRCKDKEEWLDKLERVCEELVERN